MKTLRFTAYLLYRYYSSERRPDSIPFFRTLCTMTLLGFIHLFQILLLVNQMNLMPSAEGGTKLEKRLAMALVLAPIYLILSLLVKKKHVIELQDKYSYEWDKVFKCNVWFIIYIITSVSLLILLIYLVKK